MIDLSHVFLNRNMLTLLFTAAIILYRNENLFLAITLGTAQSLTLEFYSCPIHLYVQIQYFIFPFLSTSHHQIFYFMWKLVILDSQLPKSFLFFNIRRQL